MSRWLYIAVLSTVAACHTSKPPAPVGNTTPVGSPGSSSPTSAELIAMVRSSTLPPTSECTGNSDETTLGAIYAAHAQIERNEAKDMNVPFVEDGSCKPAPGVDNMLSCSVVASPDWTQVKDEPGGEEGGGNFAVTFQLDANGVIVASTLYCVAAG